MTLRLVVYLLVILAKGPANAQSLLDLRDTLQGGLHILPVTIGERTYDCVLDSGSTHHVFDQTIENQLGEYIGTSTAQSPGGAVSVRLFKSPVMQVSTLPPYATERPIVSLDLSSLRRTTGTDVYGILGAEFFQGRIVQLDSRAGNIRILSQAPAPDEVTKSFSITINQSGQMFVRPAPGVLSYRASDLLIDTGASGEICIEEEEFDRLHKERKIELEGSGRRFGIFGMLSTSLGRLDKFCMGEFCHSSIAVERDVGSRVGLSYLRRYTVTIDHPERRLYLSPGEAYDYICEHDMSGLGLGAVGGQVVVAFVDALSPAEKVGVRLGDAIMSMDGMHISATDVFRVRQELSLRPGKAIALVVRRGRELLSFTIVLRRQPWK